jgi:hypothetical protein
MGKPNTKAFSSNVTLSPDEERTVVATISTSAVDREGEVLIPQGMRSKDFERNPIVFYNHSYADFMADSQDKLPIGRVTDLKRSETEVIAKVRFADKPANWPAEKPWLPDTLFSLYQQKVLSGWSVGFNPIERRPASDRDVQRFGAGCRLVTSKWDLFELSVAPLQCNQEAVTLAVSKGLIKRELADKIFKHDKIDPAIRSTTSNCSRPPQAFKGWARRSADGAAGADVHAVRAKRQHLRADRTDEDGGEARRGGVSHRADLGRRALREDAPATPTSFTSSRIPPWRRPSRRSIASGISRAITRSSGCCTTAASCCTALPATARPRS